MAEGRRLEDFSIADTNKMPRCKDTKYVAHVVPGNNLSPARPGRQLRPVAHGRRGTGRPAARRAAGGPRRGAAGCRAAAGRGPGPGREPWHGRTWPYGRAAPGSPGRGPRAGAARFGQTLGLGQAWGKPGASLGQAGKPGFATPPQLLSCWAPCPQLGPPTSYSEQWPSSAASCRAVIVAATIP
jgi:hypothetical protein